MESQTNCLSLDPIETDNELNEHKTATANFIIISFSFFFFCTSVSQSIVCLYLTLSNAYGTAIESTSVHSHTNIIIIIIQLNKKDFPTRSRRKRNKLSKGTLFAIVFVQSEYFLIGRQKSEHTLFSAHAQLN